MAENHNIEALYEEFIEKLMKRYGDFSKEQFRFQEASNSEIARELNYSDAQFSRLIHQSASEGEYLRAIRNIDRILNEIQQAKEIEKLKAKSKAVSVGYISSGKLIGFLAIGVAIGMVLILGYFNFFYTESSQNSVPRDNMIRWSFETAFVNPYTKLDDLPDDCNFPCYKYQGRWELKKPYKLPFFSGQNGFHYLATEVNMYARCMGEKAEEGGLIEGYEYQKHEIWYDIRKLPIDSFVNFSSTKLIMPEYQDLDFSKEDNFIKIAYVHTFFKNEFLISQDTIARSGKVIGRDIELVDFETLKKRGLSEKEIKDIRNDINRTIFNRLEDFSKPITCGTTYVPNADFNKVKSGDEISFGCTLTTSRVTLNYQKTYILIDQFIENSCQPADE